LLAKQLKDFSKTRESYRTGLPTTKEPESEGLSTTREPYSETSRTTDIKDNR